jgi:hypothetical protein
MNDDGLNAVGGHCPVCGQEYRPGFTVCGDDGAEFVPGPAPVASQGDQEDEEPRDRHLGSVRTDVADLTSELGPPAELGSFRVQDALLLAGRLRSLGVPAMAESDGDSGPYRSMPGLGGMTRVFVRPEDLERARRVTQRILERDAGAT